ncbi:Zinc finger protein 530 [Plecturocebus cupreus]
MEKGIECSDCGKSFRQVSVFIRHQSVHSEERPYECSGRGILTNTSSFSQDSSRGRKALQLRGPYCVTQAAMQWRSLGSLQPGPPRLRQSSSIDQPSKRGFTILVRLVLNSQPQVIRPPRPPKCLDYRRIHPRQSPKVLGLQARATVPGGSKTLKT